MNFLPLTLFLAAVSFLAAAHDEPHPTIAPKRARVEDVHRPSSLPDRIVLTWTDDPATTQAATWRTSTEVTRAIAQIAPASDGPQSATNPCVAVTELLETDLGPAHYPPYRLGGPPRRGYPAVSGHFSRR